MNESVSGRFSSGSDVTAEAPTPEQAAILQYLGLEPAEGTTQTQASALISQSEASPAGREKLQAWHREKYRLHPDLFAPAQRSFREARWWQARVSDETLYGYSFQQPSLDQTFVILEALDRREPGWDQENGKRRETRFMNELASLSPELCKPGCAFPHDLPPEDAPDDPPASPTKRPPAAPSAPSAPFVPGQYTAASTPFTPPSAPKWQPPVQPPGLIPAPLRAADDALAKSGGGAWKWALLLALVLAAGAGVYFFFSFHPPTLERGGKGSPATGSPSARSPSANAFAPAAANESRQRAMAKYPDLTKAGTVMNAKFVVAYRELVAAHDPFLLQPDWPEQLAARCAAAMAPSPAPSKATHTPTPSPAPTVQKTVASPSAAPRMTNVSTPAAPPTAAPVAPPTAVAPAVALTAPAVASAAPPAGRLFITLDAVAKSRMNNYTYHWSPYYYADYDLSFRQAVGIEVKVRNMGHSAATVNLRWMFFGRKTANNERYIFSASQKRVELAQGQTVADALDSPMLRNTAAVSYSYGTHYYSGSKYEGWLVQVLSESGDSVLAQVGSSGYLEDFGKRSDLTTLLNTQLSQ